VAALALWWLVGWPLGLAVLLFTHGAVLWSTFHPRSQLFCTALVRLPGAQPRVWLTIDDGPSDDTRPMLDLLDAHGAKATFFVVGERARARPELVREIVRRGHGLGNHSDSHPQAAFWRLGPVTLEREIAANQRSLAELAGAPPRWFRSVVGHTNPFIAPVLARHGLTRVAWSARGFDGVRCTPDRVLARIVPDLKPGAIVLLHEGAAHGHNVEILRRVLTGLEARGLSATLP
jgi:peptidoglycan/xylan/chitin deacetylase (PgdA/CDA1 family)